MGYGQKDKAVGALGVGGRGVRRGVSKLQHFTIHLFPDEWSSFGADYRIIKQSV